MSQDEFYEKAGTDREKYIVAFVRGAQWWEWNKTGATMWNADRDLAERQAKMRYDDMTPSTGSDALHSESAMWMSKEWNTNTGDYMSDAPHSESTTTAPNNITITDRVSLRVDPNNPDHLMGCDDETLPGAYGKPPTRLEQLESIVRRFAKLPINDTCAVQSDADKLCDLIRRSRELTQKDKP